MGGKEKLVLILKPSLLEGHSEVKTVLLNAKKLRSSAFLMFFICHS
jgi:hypothetical protein